MTKFIIECNEKEFETLKKAIGIAMCHCDTKAYEDVKTALNTVHSFHTKTNFVTEKQCQEIECEDKRFQIHRGWLHNNGIKYSIKQVSADKVKFAYYPVGEKERQKCRQYFERQINEGKL